jgi:hypothetical protein
MFTFVSRIPDDGAAHSPYASCLDLANRSSQSSQAHGASNKLLRNRHDSSNTTPTQMCHVSHNSRVQIQRGVFQVNSVLTRCSGLLACPDCAAGPAISFRDTVSNCDLSHESQSGFLGLSSQLPAVQPLAR